MSAIAAPLMLLGQAVRLAVGDAHSPVTEESDLIDPQMLRLCLEGMLAGAAGRIRIAGTLERRLVFIERLDGRWVVADLAGRQHQERSWPAWASGHIQLDEPGSWLSLASVDDHAVHRLSRPNALLAALYHPEHFPLPRFPLGISDVARAARSTLLGTVRLADMQLGVRLDDLVRLVRAGPPDILGISATFGQHDLMTSLLDAVYARPGPPLIIAGGSLTARNEEMLLERYPKLLVARAGGEATIEGLLAYWHGDVDLDQVPGLGFVGSARGGGIAISRRHTARPLTRDTTSDILPELDLLPATFEHGGVAQLETSRGCTNYCSFCPRGHKGLWAGPAPDRLPWMLSQMGAVFDRYPQVSRTVYLVDEEFIGRDDDAGARAVGVARAVHEAGFQWESSCRIDQVVRPDRDLSWHAGRAEMWRTLMRYGLRRMLFGVESGVDTILDRFNKETTGQQNVLAIRTLSALGVPTRFTYITFDHLMTLEELKASYAWQGRRDVLLQPQAHLTGQQIAQAVRDEEWVLQQATGQPLHTAISYMLVSMECLTGAAYTRKVQAAGLAGKARPSMGRVDARFADWRIGLASEWSQRWIDRNFALDYTLKSLEKLLDGMPRHAVRQARTALKEAAYTVLGKMISEIEGQQGVHHPRAETETSARIAAMLDSELGLLQICMETALRDAMRQLPAAYADALYREHQRWGSGTGWRLINAADPCGT
jgi:radical SAM superfamily enzyme YgiQ (UPF0313 family)